MRRPSCFFRDTISISPSLAAALPETGRASRPPRVDTSSPRRSRDDRSRRGAVRGKDGSDSERAGQTRPGVETGAGGKGSVTWTVMLFHAVTPSAHFQSARQLTAVPRRRTARRKVRSHSLDLRRGLSAMHGRMVASRATSFNSGGGIFVESPASPTPERVLSRGTRLPRSLISRCALGPAANAP
jgi:hypothetical protein